MELNLDNFSALEQDKQSLVLKHLELVLKANETCNLTRIENKESGLLLHIEDSLSALEEMNRAPKGAYADIGSGGGFPGIPLAIATGRETTLIDTRKKKMLAVEGIIQELGLSNQITTKAARAELYARLHPNTFSVVTARALAQLGVLLELSSPLLQKGGHLICFKAHVDNNEFNHSLEVAEKVGMKLLSNRSFILKGEEEYARRIFAYKKIGNPTLKLPRQEGLAQKKPL